MLRTRGNTTYEDDATGDDLRWAVTISRIGVRPAPAPRIGAYSGRGSRGCPALDARAALRARETPPPAGGA